MSQAELILYIIKLVLGGVFAFCAILLLSRTREISWVSIVAGVVLSYAGVVYDMLLDLGIILPIGFRVAGIPFVNLFFAVVPTSFFIYGFILTFFKHR